MTGDTFDRSLAHWSEASRSGMDAFYAVATQDYRHLVEASDFGAFLRQRLGAGELRVLDVACGSGKFPAALSEHALADAQGTIVLDLLDPSPFSIAEARASLRPPFRAGRELCCTLQELPADSGPYELLWAVHALYALPEAELEAGVAALLRALAPGGLGLVAHARASAHYLAFYEAYRASRNPKATPYTSAEALIAAFRHAGARVELRELSYEQEVSDEAVLEGFLQRCLFDDSLDLAEMRRDPALGPYLESRTAPDGSCRLRQDVAMIFVRH